MKSHEGALNSINASGQRLMEQDTLSSTDKANISRDLSSMNERWNTVGPTPLLYSPSPYHIYPPLTPNSPYSPPAPTL